MSSNKLIILEGLDRSGKTTISKIIAEKLGSAQIFRFPDRNTNIGRILDQYLQKGTQTPPNSTPIQLHLLFSANRYERADEILEALKRGHVICDRYWISGAVYSAAKGLDLDWCISIDKFLPKPDHCFFIDVDESVVSKRFGFGAEAHDKIEFLKQVYSIYKSKVSEFNMDVVDGMRSVEDIAEDIIRRIDLN